MQTTPGHTHQLFSSLPRHLNHACQNPGEGPLSVNSQRTRRRHPIQHPPTSTPSVAGRNSNYRCKAVHSLPVSTTSYFRHVVSTVQSSVIRANNGTVLNRHRRKFIFSSIPYPYSNSFPPGLQFSLLNNSFQAQAKGSRS